MTAISVDILLALMLGLRYKQIVTLKFIIVTTFWAFTIVASLCAIVNRRIVIMRGAAGILAFFNSTLNPFLYCWKISEVRQAVKRTIRQAFSRP